MYVLGNCLVNELEDKKLSKILKQEHGKLSTDENSKHEVFVIDDDCCHDFCKRLLEGYVELQSDMSNMKKKMKNMEARIEELESQATEKKLKSEDMKNSITNLNHSAVSDAQSIVSELKVRNTLEKLQKVGEVDYHSDANGRIISGTGDVRNLNPEEIITVLCSPQKTEIKESSPFRHRTKERKTIIKGKRPGDTEHKQNVTKGSNREKKFKITAAKLTPPMQGPTHLIYVGKLDSSTEETALREHYLKLEYRMKRLLMSSR